jgi:hypothetical protein
MIRLLSGSTIVLAIVAICLLAGCGGGGGVGGGDKETVKHSTVEGSVVHADTVASGIAGAEVELRSRTGEVLAKGSTDGNGHYSVDLYVPKADEYAPVDVVIVADTPNESSYGSQQLPPITLHHGDTVSIIISVLRVDQSAPTSISLTPESVEVDARGLVQFTGTVMSGGTPLSVVPTYMVKSSVGSVDSNGFFQAVYTTVNLEGDLTAVCGEATATAHIRVVPQGNPRITSFFVDPVSVPGDGGDVAITVAANDGDGILSVFATVYDLTDNTTTTVPMPLADLTLGTYRGVFSAPPNDNPHDGAGHQDPQRYSIQVTIHDYSYTAGPPAVGETLSDFVDVVVAGLDAPPPPGG